MKPNSKIASFFNALFVDFRHLNIIAKIEKVVDRMNPSEKIFFFLVSLVCVVSGLVLLIRVHNSFLVAVPSFGGSFTEGVVGSPRFINPVLAISDTDKDLVTLVYSGLLKVGDDGFVEDLASSYEIKEGGTVYDFVIKDSAYFHDGKKVTADDVIFTVAKILDPVIKSPKRANWEGVRVEKISDQAVRFTLEKPYAPFLEALTVGILPKHIWEKASSEEFPFSEFNIDPIGSGPYKIKKIGKNGGGIPTIITLSSFHNYALGRPKIESIVFKFFQNENDLHLAYEDRSVDSMAGLSPTVARSFGDNKNLLKNAALPRVFGVFLNQNLAPVFLNKEVREALNIAAPKQQIVDEVLYGFGRVLNGPTPLDKETDSEIVQGNAEKAKSILLENGWKENENGLLEKKAKTGTTLLSFSITTSDAPELKKTAQILEEAWEKLGAQIDVKIFEPGDLSQNIIRGRKYDALLFGEMVGAESDLYPFWHSSQRIDPGLNISLYTNITVDKMLEEIQRNVGTSSTESMDKKDVVVSEIKNDIPVIFLFSPNLLYVAADEVKNVLLKDVSSQNEIFLSINKWFIETDKVWKIFVPKNQLE